MINVEHISVRRTARFATLGSAGWSVQQVWFVLHGYGQLASPFLRQFEALDDGTRLLVAPEGLSRFYSDPEHLRGGASTKVGASWMTREDRLNEIEDYVRYLDAVAAKVLSSKRVPVPPIVVLGFSQGVATAVRWVAHGNVAPRRLILWAGSFPPDVNLGSSKPQLSSAALTVVVGTRDPLVSPEVLEREERRLREGGIPYELRTFPGGHELSSDVLLHLAGTL